MPHTILLLGPIVFQDFEVPEKVNFGGTQRLAIHQLPGGARVIDSLGRDDADISFTGIFSGADATLRARGVDELRALGMVLPLTWDVFTYSVVIREFTAQYERAGWIPFRITCTVLRDEASALIQAPLGLATSLLGDCATAGTLSAGLGIASIASALAATSHALTATGATQRGSAAYAHASTTLALAHDTFTTCIATAEADFNGADLTQATGLERSTEMLEKMSFLTAARCYAGRAVRNLANASS